MRRKKLEPLKPRNATHGANASIPPPRPAGLLLNRTPAMSRRLPATWRTQAKSHEVLGPLLVASLVLRKPSSGTDTSKVCAPCVCKSLVEGGDP